MDHRDGTENGFALDIVTRSLVGSQNVPYIYEDYVSVDDTATAIYDLYSMGKEKRQELGNKAKAYVESEFKLQNTIDLWHDSLYNLVQDWREGKRVVPRYETMEF